MSKGIYRHICNEDDDRYGNPRHDIIRALLTVALVE